MSSVQTSALPSIDRPWRKIYDVDPDTLTVPAKTAYQYILDSSQSRLDLPAIDYMGTEITYRNLFERVDKVTGSLYAHGIRKDAVVTLMMANSPEFLASFYGLNRLGAYADFIDLRAKGEELLTHLKTANPKMVILSDVFLANLMEVIDQTLIEKVIVISPGESFPPMLKFLYGLKVKKDRKKDKRFMSDPRIETWADFISKSTAFEEAPFEADHGIVILHTSGTTGAPKGVILTNENFNGQCVQMIHSRLHCYEGDRFMSHTPTFLGYSILMSLHYPLSYGAHIIQLPNYEPEKFAENVYKHKVNVGVGGPADWSSFIAPGAKKHDYTFLRGAISGGDKIEPDHKILIDKTLQSMGFRNPILEGYGMSETSTNACVNQLDHVTPRSVGLPMPMMNFKIVDPDSGEELGFDQTGEICMTGPTIMKGYFNNAAATREAIEVDAQGRRWMHSGDLGHINKEGFIFIDGRMKRLVVTHMGLKVSPFAIEDILLQLPELNNVTVVSGPDKVHGRGGVPVAFVVLNPGVDFAEFEKKARAHCLKNLKDYQQVAAYFPVEKIKLTRMNKIDYRTMERDAAELMK